jgi:hypothetical protein
MGTVDRHKYAYIMRIVYVHMSIHYRVK